MKTRGIFIAALAFLLVNNGGFDVASAQKPADNPVVQFDPALDKLISSNAKVELVKGGFGFTEGTTWVKEGASGFLLFSDIPANGVFKIKPDGEVSLYLNQSGYRGDDIDNAGFEQTNGREPSDPKFRKFFMIGSNGLTLDRQGRLLIATWAGRSVDRIEKDGTRTVLADKYNGKRFGGPNDIIAKKDGTIYFTDGYGGMRGRDKDSTRELDSGVYMIKDGKVTLLMTSLQSPNGLALSPDERYLYANDTFLKVIRRFEVKSDDTVTNGQLLFDASEDKTAGNFDGMRVDIKGNIYESGPGGIWIISPNGKHLGTIRTPEIVANLEFGGVDNKDVYIAAREGIYRIRVITPGIRASK